MREDDNKLEFCVRALSSSVSFSQKEGKFTEFSVSACQVFAEKKKQRRLELFDLTKTDSLFHLLVTALMFSSEKSVCLSFSSFE